MNSYLNFLIQKNRKFQSVIEQRDSKYKHDKKKLEKEIEKLKERILVLTNGKTKELPSKLDLFCLLYLDFSFQNID